MARGKNKKSKKLVLSKKARRKKTRPRARDKLVKRHWRGRLTVSGNYERMGLAANCNRKRKRGARVEDKSGGESGAVVEMEQAATQAREAQESHEAVYIDWHSKQTLTRLISKHAADYEAMARDSKLNVWQRTPAQLRRQCQRLLRAVS